MKLKSARQAWHDAFFAGKENTLIEFFQLGVAIQKTMRSNSLNVAIHAWIAGRIQHVISLLPENIKGFGNFMYSPLRTIDDLENGQEAVFDHFRFNYKGDKLTEKKLEQIYYLVIAAMYEYFFIVYGNSSPFKTASDICRFLYDEKGIKMDNRNWGREFGSIYENLLMSCNYIDKTALEPVVKVIKKYRYKEVA